MVLGAVTTLGEPVQGCQIHALGSIRYAATCTPEFRERHFAKGVTAQALAQAPVLVFNRKDDMQSRFARRMAGDDLPSTAPTWWIPSTRAFVQANLGGLGWTMNPLPLVKRHLDAGRLVYVRPRVGRRAAVLAALEGRRADHGPADPRGAGCLLRADPAQALKRGRRGLSRSRPKRHIGQRRLNPLRPFFLRSSVRDRGPFRGARLCQHRSTRHGAPRCRPIRCSCTSGW